MLYQGWGTGKFLAGKFLAPAPAPEFFFQAAPAPAPGIFFRVAPAPRGQKTAPSPDYWLSLANYSFPRKLGW